MADSILFVDDDPLILSGWERSLRRTFDLQTALGPKPALEKIAAGARFAVIVSDMRMPDMNGLQFLEEAHRVCPDSLRLILTGNADLRTAIEAVNQGDIFRFLEKPCPPDVLSKVLTAALDQYRLLRSEKDLLEKTLHGSIKMLTDVLALVNPEAFSTASRITLYVKHVSTQLGLKDTWRYEMAAMLSQLGCVVLPNEILEAVRLGQRLSKDQEARFAAHPSVARDLLRNIPRLESVASMVGRQQETWRDQTQLEIGRRDDETLGAQILKVCIRFESLVRSGLGHVAALQSLLANSVEYDPAITASLSKLPAEVLPCESECIPVEKLLCMMVLDEDLRTREGTLLVAKGVEITETLLTRIHNFASRGSLKDSIRVLVPISVKHWCERQAGNIQSVRVTAN
jgi:response regulator RpfG family c-di-GMP phosphodiesterase